MKDQGTTSRRPAEPRARRVRLPATAPERGGVKWQHGTVVYGGPIPRCLNPQRLTGRRSTRSHRPPDRIHGRV
jgi:hypothetical protein